MMAAAPPRPGIGVGVFVLSPDHPGCVLLGKRISKSAAGSGTWALPGGHLERGESWAACAAREVKEETGLIVQRVRTGTVLNVVERESDYHYVVVLMVADAPAGAIPENCEPEKCAGWTFLRWDEELPSPLFESLRAARIQGFDPFDATALGAVLQDADDALPPYCCCILHEPSSGAVLLEQRGRDAKVAANKLTCFGGKREAGEEPLDAIRRELREELGLRTVSAVELDGGGQDGAGGSSKKRPKLGGAVVCTPRRAVDLYVDGKLIAWFFEAPAPARDAPLVFEEGRSGVWLAPSDEAATWASVSDWHEAVLQAWRRGERRVDFTSPR